MLGSIKAIHLILLSITSSAALSTLINENDDYNFFKFKLEIRNFLIEILDYLRKQHTDMNSFTQSQNLDSNTSKNVCKEDPEAKSSIEASKKETSQTENDENQLEIPQRENHAHNAAKKVKLDEREELTSCNSSANSTFSSNSNSNPVMSSLNKHLAHNQMRMHIFRQVESKRKYLEQVIQYIIQTINFLSTSLSVSPFASTSTNSDSSQSESDSSEASNESSVPFSPSHELNVQKS